MKAKLRFHLAKGINFMKWQYTDTEGVKHYKDPETFGCFQHGVLKNRRSTAEKINSGANKSVCAWVEYRDEVFDLKEAPQETLKFLTQVYYNPRKLPYWHDVNGNNMDNVEGIVTVVGKEIYVYLLEN